MMVSFEGIGQWSATFACTDVQEGQVVKISGSGEVGKCVDGEAFCGVVNTVGRDGEACGVVLGGMVSVPYTGRQSSFWNNMPGLMRKTRQHCPNRCVCGSRRR